MHTLLPKSQHMTLRWPGWGHGACLCDMTWLSGCRHVPGSPQTSPSHHAYSLLLWPVGGNWGGGGGHRDFEHQQACSCDGTSVFPSMLIEWAWDQAGVQNLRTHDSGHSIACVKTLDCQDPSQPFLLSPVLRVLATAPTLWVSIASLFM